ncbi:30S ribosomal protein S20 [Alphaproteobacteria bacterium]
MANHESAVKAHRQSKKRALRNRNIKSKVKTFISKVEDLVKRQNLDIALPAFRAAESEIMKSVTKGILKLNTASRKVSRLAKKIKVLESANL